MRFEITRERDPKLIELENQLTARISELFPAPLPSAHLPARKTGIPADNVLISPEQAMRELLNTPPQ